MPKRGRRPHMTKDQRAECLALYAARATRNDLADRYDRDVRTIDRLITKNQACRPRPRYKLHIKIGKDYAVTI